MTGREAGQPEGWYGFEPAPYDLGVCGDPDLSWDDIEPGDGQVSARDPWFAGPERAAERQAGPEAGA